MDVLVLEGGGMRGVYTSGVLEAFSEADNGRGVSFDRIVACSAGACAAASYLARQPERNRRVYLDFLDGDKLIRYRRLLTGGNVMDIDYLTDKVTAELCPLDIDGVRRHRTPIDIGVTDYETGRACYLSSRDDDLLVALRATCALPFFYRGRVLYRGRRFVDGGVADPVPLAHAVAHGARSIVLVLTSSIEKRGNRSFRVPGLHRLYSSSPAIRRALQDRHLRYREAARLAASPPGGVRVQVIRPSRPLPVKRTTTDRSLLEEGCDLGYEDGRAFLSRFDSASVETLVTAR